MNLLNHAKPLSKVLLHFLTMIFIVQYSNKTDLVLLSWNIIHYPVVGFFFYFFTVNIGAGTIGRDIKLNNIHRLTPSTAVDFFIHPYDGI